MAGFEFPLEVPTIETVPEQFRALYQEADGKFALLDDLKKKVDVSGLKSALELERKTVRETKERAASYLGLNKTPEEIQALIQAADEAAQKEAEKRGEWDKLKNQLLDSNKLTVAEKDKAIEAMKGKLERHFVEAEAAKQIADAKGSATVLLPHVKSQVRMIEEDGEYQVRVVNSKGEPRINAAGEFLTIKDLVAEMRESKDFGCAFQGTGTSGGGTPPNAAGGGTSGGDLKRSKMSTEQKATYITEHGNDLYQKLPW